MWLEQFLIYGAVFLFSVIILWVYIRKLRKESMKVAAKIEQAKQEGLFEPVSLHPVIDLNTCIKSGRVWQRVRKKIFWGLSMDGQPWLMRRSVSAMVHVSMRVRWRQFLWLLAQKGGG